MLGRHLGARGLPDHRSATSLQILSQPCFRTLRTFATGRSWRARLSRGAAVFALGALWMAPTFGWLPPLALYNTSELVPPGLYLYLHDAAAPRGLRGTTR